MLVVVVVVTVLAVAVAVVAVVAVVVAAPLAATLVVPQQLLVLPFRQGQFGLADAGAAAELFRVLPPAPVLAS